MREWESEADRDPRTIYTAIDVLDEQNKQDSSTSHGREPGAGGPPRYSG